MRIIDNKRVYTVSEVNYFARQTLEQMEFWVEGEISRCDKNPSYNFYYLTLKDEYAILPSIAESTIINQEGKNLIGLKVLASGYLSLYESRGQYQFKIQKVEEVEEGILQKKTLETILKLKSEGLFEQKYKKEIPTYPKKICLITSYGSDAFNDFKRHTVDKFPIIELHIANIRVQGNKSVLQLLKIIPKVDMFNFDVIVITRGGGSLEDLAAFNDEGVTRAIFKMKTPIIVAIGHEANESLAEWVADVRASTPTDAANIVTAGYTQVLEKLQYAKQRLNIHINYYFSINFQKLDYIYRGFKGTWDSFKDLPRRINASKELLKKYQKYLILDAENKSNELFRIIKNQSHQVIKNKEQNLERLKKFLMLLSPGNTLERGYAIAKDENGKVIKSIKSVVLKSLVGVILNDGSFEGQVELIKRNG